MNNDATLEEMWRIKEKLSAPQLSWKEYATGLYAFESEERKRGVKFASLPPKRPDGGNDNYLFVAEHGVEYDPRPPAPTPAP